MTEEKLLAGMEEAARHAGEIMLSATEIQKKTSEKEGHGNFVTEYDKKVQAYLFSALKELLPEARFLGEEDGAETFRPEYREGYLFVIDPIDGTANFLTGFRPSVTSIALFLDGAPYLAAVYNPYDDLMYTAKKGGGAFLNGKRIHSLENDLDHSLVCFGSAPYYDELLDLCFALARKYMKRGMDIRLAGTAAWDLCMLAEGRIGLFFELKLGLWDFAAGALIAAEAGCTVTDAAGKPLTFDGPSSVTAASAGVAREGHYLPAEVLGIGTAL